MPSIPSHKQVYCENIRSIVQLIVTSETSLTVLQVIYVIYNNDSSSRSCRQLQLYIASSCGMTIKMGKNAEVM